MLPVPTYPGATLSALPGLIDRALASGASDQLSELARAFPGAYAFFYALGCDAEDAADFDAADRHFARAKALLEHLADRLPSEERILASLH